MFSWICFQIFCETLYKLRLRRHTKYVRKFEVRCSKFKTATIAGRTLEEKCTITFYVWKVKVNQWHTYAGRARKQIHGSIPFETSAPEEGGWWAQHPGRFTPGKDPLPTAREAGWGSGPVWTGTEKLLPSGIRSKDRPSCNASLYHLSYPGHEFVHVSI
jgi:hypothetical protein